MQVSEFIKQMQADNAQTRALAAGVIGLVEEARGFDALKAAYPRETNTDARKMMDWAGKRLAAAAERGYDTFEDVLERFGVLREINSRIQMGLSEREEELLRRIASSNAQDSPLSLRPGGAMGNAIGGYIMGGVPGAALAMWSNSMKTRFENQRMDADPLGSSERRAIPPVPTDTDPTPLLKTLYSSPDPRARQQALMGLAATHQVQVVPQLVVPFIKDRDADTRATIERVGKSLYLGGMYYQLSQAGHIEQEIEKRVLAFRDEMDAAGGNARPVPRENQEASKEEIAKLLSKGKSKRRKGRR